MVSNIPHHRLSSLYQQQQLHHNEVRHKHVLFTTKTNIRKARLLYVPACQPQIEAEPAPVAGNVDEMLKMISLRLALHHPAVCMARMYV